MEPVPYSLRAVGSEIAQAETTDRRVPITKDVPVLRIDHIPIKDMLLGVWPVSYNGVTRL